MNCAEPRPSSLTVCISWRFTDQIGIGAKNATGAGIFNPLKIDKTCRVPQHHWFVKRVFEIALFRIDPEARVLTRDGIAAPLGPRAVVVRGWCSAPTNSSPRRASSKPYGPVSWWRRVASLCRLLRSGAFLRREELMKAS
jgi:hypothetical protein